MAWQGKTSVAGKSYSRKAIEADINYLTKVVARVHPNMYHCINERQYHLLIDSVKKYVHDGMIAQETWPLLARLIGSLGEGHSVMDFPSWIYDTLKNGQALLFPILVHQYAADVLNVKADLSGENKLVAGDRITAINDLPVPELIDKLSTYCGGMRSYRAIDVCNNLSACFYLYCMPLPYRIRFFHEEKLDSIEVNPITYADFVVKRAQRLKYQPAAESPLPYFFENAGPCCAFLTINTFNEKPAHFRHFLDSCFSVLKAFPSQNLIIDLRYNGGGNSALGEILLGYITDKPFRMTGGEKWKVSKEYKTYLLQNHTSLASAETNCYLNASNGKILNIAPEKIKRAAKNSLLYKGMVWVLIGPQTFSSANMLANVIKDFRLAILLGTATGEPANDYGELIYLTLPNTGFSFTTSTKQFIRANGDMASRLPVIPDYLVGDTLLNNKKQLIQFIKSH